MSVQDRGKTQQLSWVKLPDEHWYRAVEQPVSATMLAELNWPIRESEIRRKAYKQGFMLESLGDGQYRLWELVAQDSDCVESVPVDLTANCEYVDSLAGIACFLFLGEDYRAESDQTSWS